MRSIFGIVAFASLGTASAVSLVSEKTQAVKQPEPPAITATIEPQEPVCEYGDDGVAHLNNRANW